jgi:hypothetical protein
MIIAVAYLVATLCWIIVGRCKTKQAEVITSVVMSGVGFVVLLESLPRLLK